MVQDLGEIRNWILGDINRTEGWQKNSLAEGLTDRKTRTRIYTCLLGPWDTASIFIDVEKGRELRQSWANTLEDWSGPILRPLPDMIR